MKNLRAAVLVCLYNFFKTRAHYPHEQINTISNQFFKMRDCGLVSGSDFHINRIDSGT